MPVRFDSEKIKEQPDIALVLVIDRSGSMQGPKLEAAKESARVTAEVLSPNDYHRGRRVRQRGAGLRPPAARVATACASRPTSRACSRAAAPTSIPGLKEAYEILQGINAKVKHVIVLSDGEAPYDGIAELVQDMRAARITVSCGRRAGRRSQPALDDRRQRRRPPLHGRGHRRAAEDLHEGDAPRRRSRSSSRTSVHVRVAKKVEAIEGTGVENAPPLHGYVTTKPKPTGEAILISDLGEPILARWRYGAGTSVAWTSDVKNRWSVDWIRWGGYPKFWAQVVRSVDAPQGLRQLRPVREGRRRPRAGHRRRDRLRRQVRQRARHHARGHRSRRRTRSPQTVPMDADRRRPLHRRLPDPEVRQLPAQGRAQARRQHRRRVARLGRPCPTRSSTCARRRTRSRCKHAAQVSGGIDQAKPAQIWDAARRVGAATRRTCGRTCCSSSRSCSCSTSTRSACACSATARSSSSSRVVAQALS